MSTYSNHDAECAQRRTLEEVKKWSCPDLHEAQISPARAWAFLDGWVPVLRPISSLAGSAYRGYSMF